MSASLIIDPGLHSIFNHPRLNILMQQAITELGGLLTREIFEDWPSNNPFTSSHHDVLISLIRDEHFLTQGHLYILFIFK